MAQRNPDNVSYVIAALILLGLLSGTIFLAFYIQPKHETALEVVERFKDIEDSLSRPPSLTTLRQGVYRELMQKSKEELLFLKTGNPCHPRLLNCRGLQEEHVKPLVDAAHGYVQSNENTTIAWRGFLVSLGSLCISFLALVVGVLALRAKRKEGATSSPVASV
jgi:hypothetical protein